MDYEEIWTENDEGAVSFGCTLCRWMRTEPSIHWNYWQGEIVGISKHLLEKHKFQYVAFDELSEEEQEAARTEFGMRWHRELWYFRHQETGKVIGLDVPEHAGP